MSPVWITLQALVWAFGLRAALELRREFGSDTITWTAFVWAVASCLVMDLAMLAQSVTTHGAFPLVSSTTGIVAGGLMAIVVTGLLRDFRSGVAARSRIAWDRLGVTGLLMLSVAAWLVGNHRAFTQVQSVLTPMEGAVWLVVSAGGAAALLWRSLSDEHHSVYRPHMLAAAFAAAFVHSSLTPFAWLTGWAVPDGLGPLAGTVFILTIVTSLYGTLLRVRGRRLADAERQVREAQEQLFSVEKLVAVGTLAAGAAHDFNNALTLIEGSIHLALDDETLQGRPRADVEAALRAARDAEAISRNLLTLARRNSGPHATSLREAVTSPLDALTKDFARHNIAIIRRCPDPGDVELDGSSVSQVCLNLYLNARDAMMPTGGGQLQVSLERSDDWVVIAVSDTGTGIPEHFIPRMFQPLQTTKGNKGTGLGLAGSKAIVEAMGGRIEFETALGRGTTFRVVLPVRPQVT